MKLVLLASALASAHAFRPERIALADLLSQAGGGGSSFLDALTQVGIVAVSSIPGYADQKTRALSAFHGCLALGSDAADAEQQTFPDGTVRQTLATHTVPGPGGAQKIFRDGAIEVEGVCKDFARASDLLRATIAEVTQAFADRLGSIVDTTVAAGDGDGDGDESPLLSTSDGAYDFRTVGDVVENGEHLEHFHSYQRGAGSDNNNNVSRGQETIELHTDQGLFIAFTPGMIAGTNGNAVSPTSPSSTAGGFYIEQKDGSLAEVDFDPNDLVFMLGDGVNQYVNPRIVKAGGGARTLRAVPHALTMPDHAEDEARVWHGRMVLPPSEAVHPEHGRTFGDLRRLMIEATVSSGSGVEPARNEGYLNIGCSSPSAAARLLSGGDTTACEGSAIYCWHSCMSPAEHGVSEEICADQGRRLACLNPRQQVYVEGHGDYYPACTNSEELATPYPNLPAENGYPRNEDTCTDANFAAFASSTGQGSVIEPKSGETFELSKEGYDHVLDLGTAVFMWSIREGKVDGRLAFNGLFGFLAFGLAGPEGSGKNGMHNASIIMALPGGNYSAATGLDLSLDPTVQEFNIDPQLTAFRHWMDPIAGRDTTTYRVESTDCYTAMTFKTDSINGIKFNLEGKDELLWAANSEDYYVGYHGRDSRARFAVNWGGEEIGEDATEDTHDDGHDDGHDDVHAHDEPHTHSSFDHATSPAVVHSIGVGVLSLGFALAFGMA